MSNVSAYQGRLSRTCPHCGVTVDVSRPARQTTTASQRKSMADELRLQILWEALCDGETGCRAWWNALALRVQHGYEHMPLPDIPLANKRG